MSEYIHRMFDLTSQCKLLYFAMEVNVCYIIILTHKCSNKVYGNMVKKGHKQGWFQHMGIRHPGY